MRGKLAIGLLVLALTAWACGGGDDDSDTSSSTDHSMNHGSSSDDASEDFSFGEPADPEDADREIAVVTLDTLKFDPETIDVELGETVTFVVSNEGNLEHEFVIGDEHFQDSHADGMDHTTDQPNSVYLDPGETGTLTWTFSEADEVLFACHVEDHYPSGMVGDFNIAE